MHTQYWPACSTAHHAGKEYNGLVTTKVQYRIQTALYDLKVSRAVFNSKHLNAVSPVVEIVSRRTFNPSEARLGSSPPPKILSTLQIKAPSRCGLKLTKERPYNFHILLNSYTLVVALIWGSTVSSITTMAQPAGVVRVNPYWVWYSGGSNKQTALLCLWSHTKSYSNAGVEPFFIAPPLYDVQ